MSYTPTEWSDGDSVTTAKLNNLESGVSAVGYEPTEWSAGDVVTAEKLNKLEQGVAESADVMAKYFNRSITEFKIPEDPSGDGYEVGDGCYMTFLGCALLEYIEGLENIIGLKKNAFTGTNKLTGTLIFPNVITITGGTEGYVFGGSKVESISFPVLTTIEDLTLCGMSELEYAYLPSVENIGNSLQGCSKLKHIYIGADCESIGSACFGGSGYQSSGLIIDCGFAEGAVTGAPWAASNATINYNVPDPESIDAMIDDE